jgi:uncharacterized membrane protein YjjP (DUF1212 family)
MFNITQATRDCLKKFVEWGGLAGAVFYLIEGEILNALLSAVIFGVIVVFVEKYFNKIP